MSELDRIISSIIEEKIAPIIKELEQLRKTVSTNSDSEYYNAKEVVSKYKISRSTLWRLNNENKLPKQIIKGKVLYKKTDIEKAFNQY